MVVRGRKEGEDEGVEERGGTLLEGAGWEGGGQRELVE